MICLVLVALLPSPGAAVDYCDVIELNHTYDSNGRPVFTQLIFWERTGDEYRVRAWRLVKPGEESPRYNHHRHEWQVTFYDSDTLRDVRSVCFRETWTQYDVEVHDRDYWPQELRRGLRKE